MYSITITITVTVTTTYLSFADECPGRLGTQTSENLDERIRFGVHIAIMQIFAPQGDLDLGIHLRNMRIGTICTKLLTACKNSFNRQDPNPFILVCCCLVCVQ